MKLQLIATATFGLEAVVRREIENLGYQVVTTEDGKITFTGDERAIVRANLWLRTSDRVQIKMAEFKALEFEDKLTELFDNEEDAKAMLEKLKSGEMKPAQLKAMLNAISDKEKESKYEGCSLRMYDAGTDSC